MVNASRYLVRYLAAYKMHTACKAIVGFYDPEAGTFELWVLNAKGTEGTVVHSLVDDTNRMVNAGVPVCSVWAPDHAGVSSASPIFTWTKFEMSFVIEQALKARVKEECAAMEEIGAKSIYEGALHPMVAPSVRAEILRGRPEPSIIDTDPEVEITDPDPEPEPEPVVPKKLSARDRFSRGAKAFRERHTPQVPTETVLRSVGVPGFEPEPERTLDEEELSAAYVVADHGLQPPGTSSPIMEKPGTRGDRLKFWQAYLANTRSQWQVMVHHGRKGTAGRHVEVADVRTKGEALSIIKRRAEKKRQDGYKPMKRRLA